VASDNYLGPSSQSAAPKKVRWDGAAMKRVIRQWLGTDGAVSGADGRTRLTLFYSFAAIAILVAAVNTINVISAQENGQGVEGPLV